MRTFSNLIFCMIILCSNSSALYVYMRSWWKTPVVDQENFLLEIYLAWFCSCIANTDESKQLFLLFSELPRSSCYKEPLNCGNHLGEK